jgi:hypothetical protein
MSKKKLRYTGKIIIQIHILLKYNRLHVSKNDMFAEII